MAVQPTVAHTVTTLPDLMCQLRERNPDLRFDEEKSLFRTVFKSSSPPNDTSPFDRDLSGLLNQLADDIQFLRISLSV